MKLIHEFISGKLLPNAHLEVVGEKYFAPPGCPAGESASYLLRVHQCGDRERTELCAAMHQRGTGHSQMCNFTTHELFHFPNFIVMKEKPNFNQKELSTHHIGALYDRNNRYYGTMFIFRRSAPSMCWTLTYNTEMRNDIMRRFELEGWDGPRTYFNDYNSFSSWCEGVRLSVYCTTYEVWQYKQEGGSKRGSSFPEWHVDYG